METQRLPDGRLIGFDYDANGNLTDLTPPGRPTHGFDHTQVDLVRQYTPPDLGVGSEATVLQYNLDRQLDLVTRPDGLTIDPVYDPASGRLQSLLAPHGTYSYAYDPASGRLATVTDPDGGSLAFGYDGALPTSVTWTGAVAGSVTHGYNDSFEVVSQTVNGADPIAFDHDLDGLLLQAGALELIRDPATGFLDTTTLGSTADDYDFTAFGELDSYTANHGTTELYAESFTRDGLGRITDETETVEGTTTTYRYVYDLAGRLTDVERDGAPWTHYDYDPNSNRIGWTDPWGSGTAADTLYDDHDRLLAYGDKTYTYTANGELLTKTQNGQTVTYDTDVLGNLRGVTLEDGIQIDYVIDAAHRRVGKKVDGVLVQGFLYQDTLNPVAELDGTGAVVSRFVYGAKPHVPDYMVTTGITYRIISDHLGSVRLVVDADTGTVAQRLDYDPFGRVMLDTNPGFQPFGFAGGLYDPQTGLLRFGARDYDPETGRWTSKDPIGFAGGDSNLYGYVLLDPINYSDQVGLARFKGGSAAQRREAYTLQKDLRNNITSATYEFFQKYYGIDICQALSANGGPTITLEHTDALGEYDAITNYLGIDPEGLTHPDRFQATLLHELTHWAADAGLWEWHPSLPKTLTQLVHERREELRSDLSKALPNTHRIQPYVAEYIQFGDLLTLLP